MNTLKYNLWKFLSHLPFIGGNDIIVNRLRKDGCKIGYNTHIFSNVSPAEPYLVSIGNNCTISTDVIFVTHDASIGLFMGRDCASDLCGKITIGDNCFIGNRAMILYGVEIPDNTIVAAGSVVTKSIMEKGCIVGGNPAKIIGRVDAFIAKNIDKCLSLHGLSRSVRRDVILHSDKLICK